MRGFLPTNSPATVIRFDTLEMEVVRYPVRSEQSKMTCDTLNN